MQIRIISVGGIKEAFFRNAIEEYVKRLGRYCKLYIIEAKDEKTPDKASAKETENIKKAEGIRILKHIHEDDFVIALAIEGEKYSSEAFSKAMENWEISGRGRIVFIIGGSLGLSKEVLERAAKLVSFSDMTFPHQLMRVILLEQIYRSFRIRNHEPYHK